MGKQSEISKKIKPLLADEVLKVVNEDFNLDSLEATINETRNIRELISCLNEKESKKGDKLFFSLSENMKFFYIAPTLNYFLNNDSALSNSNNLLIVFSDLIKNNKLNHKKYSSFIHFLKNTTIVEEIVKKFDEFNVLYKAIMVSRQKGYEHLSYVIKKLDGSYDKYLNNISESDPSYKIVEEFKFLENKYQCDISSLEMMIFGNISKS